MESSAKTLMRKLKRIHFWILCPVVIVLGLVSWYMAVHSLKQETVANSGKINGFYSTLTSVRTKEKHANDKVAKGMDALIDRRRQEVAAAWTERWNQQTNILTWPQELSQKFREKVEGLRPIERYVDFPVPPEKELVRTLRMEYQEYIKKELVKLADQIGSAWRPGGRSGSAQRVDFDSLRFDHLLVAWNPSNQEEIESNHFDWSSTGGGTSMYGQSRQRAAGADGIPTLLEILYAQEDLWVLRSIMGVIERANEGATTRFSAAVKEIHSIEMGRNAALSRGQLVQDKGGSNAILDPSSPMLQGPEPVEQRPPEISLDPMPPDGMAVSSQFDTANMRYVDKNYEPLSGDRLRSVMKAVDLDPADATLVVAKRMPVRMRLRVDQRKLNRVLAECASAELTIEVRQVRINPEASDGAQSGGLTPGINEQRPPGMQPSSTTSASEDLFQYDVDVELYGIVYIYNPVDNTILGIKQEPPAEGEVPPTDDTVLRGREVIWTRRAAA